MKILHTGIAALGAVFLSLSVPQTVQAQFRTAPVINGASSLAEYGNEYRSPNNNDPDLLWRVTWDDTNLYVAIEDANLQEGAAIYIDLDPQQPVNTPGGNQQQGFSNYLNTNGNLPIQADLVIYAEKFYREYRFYNRETGQWGPKQEWALTGSENIGQYADNGGADGEKWSSQVPEKNFPGTVKEFSLPWSRIGALAATGERKRPENFNWFGHIHYGYDPIGPNQPNQFAGGIYGQVPVENEHGDRLNGTLYRNFNWSYYFTVLNTSAGSDNSAFGPRLGPNNTFVSSYSHTGGSIANFGSIRAYDFTLNTTGATITRTDAAAASPNTVEWNILGNLVVGPNSTLNLDPSTAPLNLSGDIIVDPSGLFSFQNATGRFRVGGDIVFANPTSFRTNAEVILTGNGDQTITGTTYRALVVQGLGTKTLTSAMSITSSLAVNVGTLATGTNTVTLGEGATFSEAENGYLLGSIVTTRTINNQNPSTFGGIGLRISSGVGQEETVTVERITGGFGVNGSPTEPNVNKTIRRRFRINSTRQTAANKTIEFTYRNTNPNELEGNNPATLQLYRSAQRTGFYTIVGTGTSTPQPGPTANTSTVVFNGSLAFNNDYFSLSSNNVPLPVELISFTGKAEGSVVRLNWVTASELQNKGFEVERRTEQGAWQKLSFVAGNGTTNQRNSYNYVDRSAVAGNNYYRLRQIDVDGKSVYSQAITVQVGAVPFSLSPVPATDVLTINGLGAGKHIAEIYNARGQRVLSQVFTDAAVNTITISSLPAGVYMVRVQGPSRSTQNARFIKQ